MKKIFLLSLLSISLISKAQIPATGLVGYWPFSGTAKDFSGNCNNGVNNGAIPSTDRFGNSNSAYYFNGSSQIDVASSSTISNFTNGQTISLWCYIDSLPTDGKEHYMIAKRDNAGSPSTKYYEAFISDFSNVDNAVYRYANSSTVSSQGTAVPFASLPIGQWFHLCFTTDLTTTKAYLNGQLYQTYTMYSPIGITNNPLVFGNSVSAPTYAPFVGKLDDIRIYNIPVDSVGVKALYTEGLCFQTVTVTDTLLIQVGITGFNPVSYSNTIKVYPNPTRNILTIDCGVNYSSLNGGQIKIINSTSQTVYSQLISSQMYTINLASLGSQGAYFLYLLDANNQIIEVKKIIIQ
jgi:hypothetical protein